MKKLILSTAFALATLASGAMAQSWNGPYAGLYAGSANDAAEFSAGLLAGYQAQMGSFVFGGEVDGSYAFTSGDTEVFARVRGGFLPSDPLLIFATGGVGLYNGSTTRYSAGIGAEARMTDEISLRADFEAQNTSLGSVLSGPKYMRLGVVWNF